MHDSLINTGVVSSPNYPNYPKNLHKTQIIQVEKGMILSLNFTMFDLPYHVNFDSISDHLKITDGDGTTLMEESFGSSFRGPNLKIGDLKLVPALPAGIISTSNRVKLTFITDDHDGGHDGWKVSWSAVRPGNNIILENLYTVSQVLSFKVIYLS